MEKRKILKFVIASLIFVGIVGATLYYYPLIKGIFASQDGREQFALLVRESGFKGVLVFLALQVSQMVLAFIPGEPIELIAGALYGTWWGLVLSLIGVFIGSCIIMLVEHLWGIDEKSKNILHKYKFLQNHQSVELMVFLLFFIPGTPKDFLIYLFPIVPIKRLKFLLISTFARFPSIITSTYAGANLASGKWENALIMFVIVGILGVGGILVNNKIVNKKSANK